MGLFSSTFLRGIACDPNNAQCNDGLAEVRAAKANKGRADAAADDLEKMNMGRASHFPILHVFAATSALFG